MAGAVSAGTYSAGAMSVLLEAIRLWEGGEVSDELLPKHRIIIKGMTSASAGSVQAALSSLDLFSASHSQNLGFDAWTSITFDKLLDISNDDKQGTVKSVLNTKALHDVTDQVIKDHRWGGEWPAYIDDEYELRLSVTNLRGVPYNLELPNDNGIEFGMSRHNEYLRYRFIGEGKDNKASEKYFLVQVGDRSKADIGNLTKGALASSAFPFAFEPVKINRPTLGKKDIHETKNWLSPNSASVSGKIVNVKYDSVNVPPSWKSSYGNKDTVYAIDGGVTNNEPLLEAFKLLKGDDIFGWGNLPDEKKSTDKKTDDKEKEYYGRVLLIDPFPNSLDAKVNEDTLRIDKQSGALKSAMVRNGRFSEPLMVSGKLKNRVGLVYPSNPLRNPPGNDEQNPEDLVLPLKSGALGGFSGFLKKDFLLHDYELGRINMMRFLRYHFTVPVTHQLVKEDANYIKQWSVKSKTGEDVVPLIPIFTKSKNCYTVFEAKVDDRVKLYQDKLSKFTSTFEISDRQQLKAGLKKRFGLVGKKLIGNHKADVQPRYEKGTIKFRESWINRSKLVKWFSGKAVSVGWAAAGKGFLTNTVLETVENNLAKQGLLNYKVFDSKGKRIGIDKEIKLKKNQND